MDKSKKNKIILIVLSSVLGLGLLISISFNIYFGLCYIKADSFLQSAEQIYIMEAGILKNNLEFRNGTDYDLKYDFSHADYKTLKSEYGLEKIAKDGTEFERALRLMDEFAPRLTHKSDYDNHIPVNANDLLKYSLDNKKHGINCRGKAQILNETCLSLGIYARKVWIMPYSGFDGDCHVVNEIWDSSLNKWVMLDITNNEYWIDENYTPLSVLEIRENAALNKFCTPLQPGDKTVNLQKLKNRYMGDFLYIVKNMAYTQYCAEYAAGESKDIYLLMPRNIDTEYKLLISKNSVERSPV